MAKYWPVHIFWGGNVFLWHFPIRKSYIIWILKWQNEGERGRISSVKIDQTVDGITLWKICMSAAMGCIKKKKKKDSLRCHKNDGTASAVYVWLLDAPSHINPDSLTDRCHLPTGSFMLSVEHIVTDKQGSCILVCFGPRGAGGLRSTPWVAEYAVFTGMISDLLSVIAFHPDVQKAYI